MITDEKPLPVEDKAVMEKDVKLGTITLELFKDTDFSGRPYFYLVLPFGDEGKLGGFLANE